MERLKNDTDDKERLLNQYENELKSSKIILNIQKR